MFLELLKHILCNLSTYFLLNHPLRSENLGFGQRRVILFFPLFHAGLRTFMTGLQIGHYHRKRSKSKLEKKKRCDLNASVQFDDCSEGAAMLRYSSSILNGVLYPLLSAFGKVGVLTD